MFTPGPAFNRLKDINDICAQIPQPDKEHIRTQLRPGNDEYKVWVKHLKDDKDSKYVKYSVEELDPDNKVWPFNLKMMDSEEVLSYIYTAKTALEDAKAEVEEEAR